MSLFPPILQIPAKVRFITSSLSSPPSPPLLPILPFPFPLPSFLHSPPSASPPSYTLLPPPLLPTLPVPSSSKVRICYRGDRSYVKQGRGGRREERGGGGHKQLHRYITRDNNKQKQQEVGGRDSDDDARAFIALRHPSSKRDSRSLILFQCSPLYLRRREAGGGEEVRSRGEKKQGVEKK